MKKFGFVLMLLGILFTVAETVYFGGNWSAASRNESICDMIGLGVSVIGFILLKIGNEKI